ncbi:hypothetical protein TL16_g09669 [Triparma laevis f. inornata]|uniref:Eukaryotic translation initiation factor 4E n=1 Tax=Triparma laevis f. inornata TaxID=1714386 RepID=A0A9W7BBB1_9STRA|nr:hypothetical protein TL16_g09669 [Triparma laevis f. inornata]
MNSGFTFWFMERNAQGKPKISKAASPTSPAAHPAPPSSAPLEETETPSSAPLNETETTSKSLPPLPAAPNWDDQNKQIATFNTVESFWNIYNFLSRPNTAFDLLLFHEGNGGRWILRLKKGLVERYWEDFVLAMIGEQLDTAIQGISCSCRYSEDVVQIWNRDFDDESQVFKIKDNVTRILNLPQWTGIEYKKHGENKRRYAPKHQQNWSGSQPPNRSYNSRLRRNFHEEQGGQLQQQGPRQGRLEGRRWWRQGWRGKMALIT